ncbi:hypothetical protein [Halorientalis marina]|uniref:hypothetical protein n=1 Tax=Halorientalis marina TaxID=2931976 RepID=UPI001FF0EE37|nr:hypothetical protein [Halorientalis marina]
MPDRDDRDRRKRDVAADFVPGELPFDAADATLSSLADELRPGIEGAIPDPDDIETVLDDATLPEVGDIDASAVVRPGEAISDEHADAIVEAGGEAVDVAIEGSGEAATVLVDTGGDVVEVAVENGGEAAAEATAELVVAALDGV